jgi:CcmD family protein
MKSITFLKAAYTIAWLVYLGYLARILLRMRRVEEEMKEVTVSSSSPARHNATPEVQQRA